MEIQQATLRSSVDHHAFYSAPFSRNGGVFSPVEHRHSFEKRESIKDCTPWPLCVTFRSSDKVQPCQGLAMIKLT